MTPADQAILDDHLRDCARAALMERFVAGSLSAYDYVVAMVDLTILDDDVRRDLLALYGNPFAPRPQGILRAAGSQSAESHRGATLFGKPIVMVDNLLPEPPGEIVLVSLDAWIEARKKAIADEADRCPKCGGREIMSTCVGILTGPDTNAATCCACGWTGEVWQLDPFAQIAESRARAALVEAVAEAPEPCEHGVVGVGEIHAERLNDAVRVTQHFACKGGCPPESKWGKGMKGAAVAYDDRLTESCEASP